MNSPELAEGAKTFQASGEAYDLFMGRYSRPLAIVFADATEIVRGHTVLDVGCFDGIVGIPLMKMCPGIKYTGIDIYEKSIVKYKERLAKRNKRAGSV